jgi:transcriptional regulator with XRE-family HTH domain
MKSKNRSFEGIAELVKTYRLRHPKKLSQVELSNLLGYKNGQFVSNVERGICSIPLKALRDLQEILNIPQNELVMVMVRDFEATVLNHLNDQVSRSVGEPVGRFSDQTKKQAEFLD